MIDAKRFQEQYELIKSKVEQIADLPIVDKLNLVGNSFESITFEYECVNYNSSHYACGETDYYTLSIPLDEINRPISFFIEKYQKQYDDKMRKIEEDKIAQEQKNKEAKEKAELTTYLQLKEKYEQNSL